MPWSTMDIGCCCGGVSPGVDCANCQSGTTWSQLLSFAISNINFTLTKNLGVEFVPGHPWDGDPYTLADLNDTFTLEQQALTGFYCRWYVSPEVILLASVELLRGNQSGGFFGDVAGSRIGATSDDLIVQLVFSEDNGIIGGPQFLNTEFLKVVATGLDTTGVPDCISLLPITINGSNFVRYTPSPPFPDGHSYVYWQGGTFVIG